jgi:hypothetical protein
VISLTFDDGLRSTFEHAAPVLARYSMPATVGIICDRLLWRRPPNAMSLDNARQLAASGWEIASHSLFHRRMEKLPPAYADEALTGWRPHRQGIFTADCPWADVGTVVEDSDYLPRQRTMAPLNNAKTGFFHDPINGKIYVRPRVATDLDSRLKCGSMERELQESRAVLHDQGFDVQSFVVPYSLWREEWDAIGQRHYAFITSVSNRVNLPSQPSVLARIPTRANFSLERQIATIEQHLEQGSWPILCLHDVLPEPLTPLDWPLAKFARLARWIADRRLTACTLVEGARRAGISSPAPHIE